MTTSLIICTYKRPGPLRRLLESVRVQSRVPEEIIIVDGSKDDATQKMLEAMTFENIRYFQVSAQDRGLTRQRNFGIQKLAGDSEIVCFLDDDTVLESDYFEQLLATYRLHPDALAVGGYISNEVAWVPVPTDYVARVDEFVYDGYKRTDGSRFVLRKKLGLDSDVPPAHFPEFGHGRSVGFLPPGGKTYPVQQIMGGVASYRREVFDMMSFSTYFEGYGLYEDADFSLRLSKKGKLYVNTAARLQHLHEPSGRPNQFTYGKMVVRNGWYVWRVAHPHPSLKARFKWHAITLLLTFVRLTNVVTIKKRKAAFTEALGRIVGWWSLFFSLGALREPYA
ncbi:glycosyltransferase [uncultured Planktosalinus sp.]|uniref:glycosyltransferase family 2 protein n=1 Tax=uncultured Planktosalinus sp. TaxID=1810935 RepID=UPI0030DBCC60